MYWDGLALYAMCRDVYFISMIIADCEFQSLLKRSIGK